MATQLLDSAALRCHQAPGPLHLFSAVLCRQLASLKIPKQLSQVLPTEHHGLLGATLNVFRRLPLPYCSAKHKVCSIIKYKTSPVLYWMLYWKWTRLAVCTEWSCRLLPLMSEWWPGHCGCCSQHHDRGGDEVALVGGMITIHNLKYNYYFQTITKSKNFKMNHHKSE